MIKAAKEEIIKTIPVIAECSVSDYWKKITNQKSYYNEEI